MVNKLQIKGLWVPLLTPFYKGQLDKNSLLKLIKSVEPYVDGFVPCLTTGEGFKMDNEVWSEVIKFVKENTQKPVAVGILKESLEDITMFSRLAKTYGCVAVVVAVQGTTADEQTEFCHQLSDKSDLPVIIYNTEKVHIDKVETLEKVSKERNIIAIKDSSGNQDFFDGIVSAKNEGKIDIAVLQGMENQLLASKGCDGYLIALANAEPELCKMMFENPTPELNNQIMHKWDEYNLASDTWYKDLKQTMADNGVIASAELI
jgi:4-hydroxy-tetrahydrodipicolinate synthase